MNARSSSAVAALSVALREHRACAIADAESRVRAADRRADRAGDVARNLLRETVEFIEWLEGEGRACSLTTDSVLRRVHRELSRLDARA